MDSDSSKPPAAQKRVSRHVKPLGPRVLVRLIRSDDRTSTGLFLPEGAKDATAQASYGKVVEVARGPSGDEGFGANVSGVPEGAYVLFPKERGLTVPWDDALRILDVKDVTATVEEIPLDEAH